MLTFAICTSFIIHSSYHLKYILVKRINYPESASLNHFYNNKYDKTKTRTVDNVEKMLDKFFCRV